MYTVFMIAIEIRGIHSLFDNNTMKIFSICHFCDYRQIWMGDFIFGLFY